MIFSILRIIVFAALLLAIAFGANWVAQNGGEIPITLSGREYRPSLIAIILLAVLFLALFWLLIKIIEYGVALIGLLMGDNKAFSKLWGKRRERSGMQALRETVLALASGNSKQALSRAYAADKKLNEPVLTGLLLAQAATAHGREKEAEAALTRLLEEEDGRFIAIRGLMEKRLANGDKDTAMKLAQKALEINGSDKDTINALMQMEIDAGDFKAARDTLKAKVRAEKMPSSVATRREAVLALAEALAMDAQGGQPGRADTPGQAGAAQNKATGVDDAAANDMAGSAKPAITADQKADQREEADSYADRVLLAHRLAPTLVPAAVRAAKIKAREGKLRAADSTILKAWNAEPHPALASAFAELGKDETPEARLRRFRPLLKRQKDHPETRMLEAELLIAAEDFPKARRAMGELGETPKTARAHAIMAAIEHGEGAEESIVRAYLAKAMNASRGPQWVCGNCGQIHADWAPICSQCKQFDSFDWKIPPESPDPSEGSENMGILLPLLGSSNVNNSMNQQAGQAGQASNNDAQAAQTASEPAEEDDPFARMR